MTSAAEMFLKHVANVVAERRVLYGEASTAMAAIAERWSVTLGHEVTPAQVILCLIDLKLVRLARDPSHEDSMVDGYGVAVMTQIIVFPLFGLDATLAENMMMGGAFTVVSIARSFALRRVFEGLHVRRGQRESAAQLRAAEDVFPDGA